MEEPVNTTNDNKVKQNTTVKKILYAFVAFLVFITALMLCFYWGFTSGNSRNKSTHPVVGNYPTEQSHLVPISQNAPYGSYDFGDLSEEAKTNEIPHGLSYERYYTGKYASYEWLLSRYAHVVNTSNHNIFKDGISDDEYRMNVTRNYLFATQPVFYADNEIVSYKISYEQLNDAYHSLFGDRDNITKGIDAAWCGSYALKYNSSSDDYSWDGGGCGDNDWPNALYLMIGSSIKDNKLAIDVLYSDFITITSGDDKKQETYKVGYDQSHLVDFDLDAYSEAITMFFGNDIMDKKLANWILEHKDYFTTYSIVFAKTSGHYYLESITKN